MPAYNTIDPAQLRYKVTFYDEQAVSDGYSGNHSSTVEVLTTWAAKEEKKAKLMDVLEAMAGQQVMKSDVAIYIRNRDGFAPRKDMRFSFLGKTYIITAHPDYERVNSFVRIAGQSIDA